MAVMDLTDWIVILAIALLAIAFFCPRTRRHATFIDRARHRAGTWFLVQGAIAFWGALLTLERSLVSPHALLFGLSLDPRAGLGVALVLVLAGCIGSIRGYRLLRRRRLFGTGPLLSR
jgi:RsiW-degrading membrane proteinase PrsW (M82 family)